MQELTLANKFSPGTNLQDDLSRTDWRFLLPDLRFNSVLCLGKADPATITLLTNEDGFNRVVYEKANWLLKHPEADHSAGIGSLAVKMQNLLALPYLSSSLDLIYIADSNLTTAILRNPDALKELSRVLKAQGAVYFETAGLRGRCINRTSLKTLNACGFNSIDCFWLTPFSGITRTALPLKDKAVAAYFFKNILYGQSFRKHLISFLGSSLAKSGLLSHIVPRRSLVALRTHVNQTAKPPVYLRSLAEMAGIDLSQYRFGLSTRGKYNSNKIIFFLFEKSANMPSFVVKMTRGAAFNFRLENEYRSLTLLKKKTLVDPNTYPEPVFLGYHNNLAVLCQRAVYGKPFRMRTSASADCEIAYKVMDWIVQLGKASANETSVSPAELRGSLYDLYENFARIYRLSEEEQKFLLRQIDITNYTVKNLPLTFQHGDPGTWNIMVSDQNKIIVIDWESGEPKGIPLWDLFYFFRTYASWMSRVHGTRDALASFSQNFLEPSPLGDLMNSMTRRYCQQLGMDAAMIEPFFYTCWMHRALKEAMRLPPAAIESGHYVNLLKLLIKSSRASPLIKLFSAQ